MSNITRRQDLGLGATARGGSGGSFAAYGRAAASSPPAPVHGTPIFDRLASISAEDWFNTPWPERKAMVSRALTEIIAATPEAHDTPFGAPVEFHGTWSSNRRSTIAWNKKQRYRHSPSLNTNVIELSTPAIRLSEPQTIASSLLHEVAHGIDDMYGGHGEGWKQKFRMLLDRHGMTETDVSAFHRATDAERAALSRRKFRGTCPQGHQSHRDGMPRTRRYICMQGSCTGLPNDERVISYEKNPEYRG